MELNLTRNSPTLCLNMIVKNESKIITRLFDSVSSIIDCYCICDTGSTDNTVELITNYFKEKNIPGKVVVEPFKNFCHNRNFALNACNSMSDYVLLLDADMILEVNEFNKNILNLADSFSILQGNDSFFYQNMRIVRNNGLYSYSGVTHEYINTPPNNVSYPFEKKNIFIRDIGDGGAKGDKFERDVRLLTEGILAEPNNVRYYFYLANSYYDGGQFEKAIEIYKKRIALGDWKEEVWYSYYRIGLCYKELGNFAEAFKFWMEGYDYYPERLEGIYEMIKHYRLISKHKLAEIFYQLAKKILDKNHNRSGYLFLHNDVYESRIYYEYSILAYYFGITNINDEAVKLFNNSKDETEVNSVLQNMKFYKDVLIKKNTILLDNKFIKNINNEETVLTSSSSCLIPNQTNDGYHMNVRYVNYYITENGSYINCDKYIITANNYIEYDTDLNIKNQKMLTLIFDNRQYIGIEDVRIFNDVETNKIIFAGTGFHKNNRLGIVTGEYNFEQGYLNYKEITQNFNNTHCEKNWVFVDYNGSSHIVYDWSPLKICKINSNDQLDVIITKEMPALFSRTRGSTCGFKYYKKINENNNGNITIDILDTEIWFVTHIVSYESPRHYYHVIAVFDSNMNLLRYSAPFKFEGEPIEYCLSIVVEDDRVLINYSTWDRTTRIGIYDKKYIDSIVKYN
uniref:Glycosyltransferase 2-like domain-containing protein n=1 Tax=viral metagenome TaxID=1070528 RepID=A0A6C0AQD8_9ZZZZ